MNNSNDGILHRAVNKYHREGLIPVLKEIPQEIRNQKIAFQAAVYTRLFEKRRVTLNDVTAAFLVDSAVEYNRTTNLVGEKPIIEELIMELDVDDVFYDIGANIGMYACFVGQVLTKGHLLAFEPETRNANKLKENLKANVPEDRWDILKVAISSKDGHTKMQIGSDIVGTGTHTIRPKQGMKDERQRTVQTRRLDTVIGNEEITQPTVLKIDVEGAEMEVLEGAKETLDGVRLIYVETHGDELRKKVTTHLIETGFDVSVLQKRGRNIFIKASKSDVQRN